MAPRPKKNRICNCQLRECHKKLFKPAGSRLSDLEVVCLDHDELEAFILCDDRELNQEDAGRHMGVSRGTVQRLLARARKKVASALAEGKALSIAPVRHAVSPPTCTVHDTSSCSQDCASDTV
ncbi:DUF134 domain-containing protein [Geobacter sp. SVR]|uniref:DUF134 domain-containing protein n=1 Tax=Geobacter sp. SVR TaxID=2495594 RepID=UPI00143EF724|nr:DUF134 domain-containing protein [Geobacter sp. SVR]BCS52083.1 hypothetical protein GSVR_03910 [Geobacter sp. SVR]GCF86538.1 hypothetical protein GSbR_31380 [Geobacter sp. SVR]